MIFLLMHLLLPQVLQRTSENVFVPLTVGGGIRDFTDSNGKHYSSLEVAAEYFRSGADKISIGSDAVTAAEEYVKTGKEFSFSYFGLKSRKRQVSCFERNIFPVWRLLRCIWYLPDNRQVGAMWLLQQKSLWKTVRMSLPCIA
jgi:hypothetical protein